MFIRGFKICAHLRNLREKEKCVPGVFRNAELGLGAPGVTFPRGNGRRAPARFLLLPSLLRFYVLFYIPKESMEDCLIFMKDADVLRSRLVRSAMWSLGAFALVLAAVMSAFLFDSVCSSKNGIALSMLAATVFFVCFGVSGGRTLYLFLRYMFALRGRRRAMREKEESPSKSREKIESLARFVEKHESAVAKTFVFAMCCGIFGFWLCSLPEARNLEAQLIFWSLFLGPLACVLLQKEMKVSSFPFMETKRLKQRPLLRCFVLAAELAIVAIGFSFLTVFSLFLVVLVFALIGAIVAGVKNLF